MSLPKIITALAFFAAIGIYGCTSSEVPWMESEADASVSQQSKLLDGNSRTAEEAVEIARGFFSNAQSRSVSECQLSVEYLTSEGIHRQNSRSEYNPDEMLAYVINRDDGGFMLVSSDKRMPEILAFSETGKFEKPEDSENVVNAMFINNLDAYKQYLIEGSDGYNFKQSDNLFDKMVELCPESAWHWNQHISPYADAVWKEHPESPVGCVGLATGIILTYCRDEVKINNRTYYAYAARWGMINGFQNKPPTPPIVIRPLNDVPITTPVDTFIPASPQHFAYAYQADALEHISKMLSDVGVALGLNYRVGRTGGSSEKANLFLRNVGCNVLHSTMQSFDINDMARQIVAGNIIYADGNTYKIDDFDGGHAWVIDGCCFNYQRAVQLNSNVEISQRSIQDVFLHCNWGENTHLIGYYRGDVFYITHNYYNYRQMRYFAVKPTRDYSN
ncbi:MAG: C10 family peptidase [Muribaculaceae bacterium]|nr:C10 family peptidase [Muribaculaceae bacterium]